MSIQQQTVTLYVYIFINKVSLDIQPKTDMQHYFMLLCRFLSYIIALNPYLAKANSGFMVCVMIA